MVFVERLANGAATSVTCSLSPVLALIRAIGGRLIGHVLAISGLLTVLQLSASLYMIAVYDYALPTGSAVALAGLTALACVLHMSFSVLDHLRARLICRAGLGLVERLDGQLLKAFEREETDWGSGLLDDVERVRNFLTGVGLGAVLDVTWLPVFLLALFLVHPALGLFGFAGTLLLAALALLSAVHERDGWSDILHVRASRYALARAFRVSGSRVPRPLCEADLVPRWRALSRSYAEMTYLAAVTLISAQALGKGARLMLQSAGVGLGAMLVLNGGLSAGALFASSLMLARTFACLDGALAHWPGFAGACDSLRRLGAELTDCNTCPTQLLGAGAKRSWSRS